MASIRNSVSEMSESRPPHSNATVPFPAPAERAPIQDRKRKRSGSPEELDIVAPPVSQPMSDEGERDIRPPKRVRLTSHEPSDRPASPWTTTGKARALGERVESELIGSSAVPEEATQNDTSRQRENGGKYAGVMHPRSPPTSSSNAVPAIPTSAGYPIPKASDDAAPSSSEVDPPPKQPFVNGFSLFSGIGNAFASVKASPRDSLESRPLATGLWKDPDAPSGKHASGLSNAATILHDQGVSYARYAYGTTESVLGTGLPVRPRTDKNDQHSTSRVEAESSPGEGNQIKKAERARLYRNDGGWKERGTGKVKIKKPSPTVQAQIIMDEDRTHKSLLNAALPPGMTMKKPSSKELQFVLFEGTNVTSYSLKFKNSELRDSFAEAMTELSKVDSPGSQPGAEETGSTAIPAPSPGPSTAPCSARLPVAAELAVDYPDAVEKVPPTTDARAPEAPHHEDEPDTVTTTDGSATGHLLSLVAAPVAPESAYSAPPPAPHLSPALVPQYMADVHPDPAHDVTPIADPPSMAEDEHPEEHEPLALTDEKAEDEPMPGATATDHDPAAAAGADPSPMAENEQAEKPEELALTDEKAEDEPMPMATSSDHDPAAAADAAAPPPRPERRSARLVERAAAPPHPPTPPAPAPPASRAPQKAPRSRSKKGASATLAPSSLPKKTPVIRKTGRDKRSTAKAILGPSVPINPKKAKKAARPRPPVPSEAERLAAEAALKEEERRQRHQRFVRRGGDVAFIGGL